MNIRKEVFGGIAVRNIGRALLMTFVASIGMGSALAQDSNTLKFHGAIGVIPVTGVSATGAVNVNVVRNVNPGNPWRIAGFDALITPDGHVRAVGRGLLLAAGNGIGTNANQSVHLSLFCGTSAATTEHDTPVAGVRLQPDGDFAIDAFLSPALPTTCTTPTLLIRNVGGGWFAAGVQKLDD
jgi:hypothetical protein